MVDQTVIFEERQAGNGKRIGFARLNAGQSLNALSQSMIDLLGPKLSAWAEDPAIACVVLLGSGDRAFCAGGDVVSLYRSMQDRSNGPNQLAERFFESEYRLDHQIHTYPKPILCWGHGIVMGGGLGLMAGASHRVVTERSRIAMPEVGIGFYPEVGATWFLNRMPGRIGLYLGLTGASINAADALYVGLADHFLLSEQQDAVFAALESVDWAEEPELNHERLACLLRHQAAANQDRKPASKVMELRDVIDRVTDRRSVAGILDALRANQHADEWIAQSLKSLEAGSPTSARVVVEQLQRGRHLSLKEAFILELNMSIQFIRQSDFAEGVRALLVDKDRNPQWRPARLEDVTDASIATYFQPPAGFETSPLANLA
jgi:enoyl-CoA hydratase/carnithine racemase